MGSIAITGMAMACCSGTKKAQRRHEKKNLRFLFQGDSITDGNRGRSEDPNHILGHGYCFAVSSRIGADFPQYGFQLFNRSIAVFERAQQQAPIDYWIWDGVHPTVFGHELMAREWIK